MSLANTDLEPPVGHEEWVQVLGEAFRQEGKAAGEGEFVKEPKKRQHFPAGGREQRGLERHRQGDQGASGTAT